MSSGLNIVAHNLQGMYTNRQLGIVNNKKAKSAEKLSTGYKINRAADDAAGLSISEKMRRQIRGLSQGTENAQDGVSMCQTADGALAEVGDMLHRITELSVKSANGTMSPSDRQDVQAEINEILQEIDRISTTTKFNEQMLFVKNTELETSLSTIDPLSIDYDDSVNKYGMVFAEAKKSLLNGTASEYAENYTYLGRDYKETVISGLSNAAIAVDIAIYSSKLRNSDLTDLEKTKRLYAKQEHYVPIVYDNLKEDPRLLGALTTASQSKFRSANDWLIKGPGVENGEIACAYYMKARDTYNSVGHDGSYGPGLKVASALYDYAEDLRYTRGRLVHPDSINGITQGIGFCKGTLAYVNTDYYLQGMPEEDYIKAAYDSLYEPRDDGMLIHDDMYLRSDISSETLDQIVFAFMSLFDGPNDELNKILENKGSDETEAVTENEYNRIWIQSGAENSDRNGMYVEIDRMDTEVLGIKDLDASTLEGARDAIGRMEPALLKLNNIRSKIGAQQNRLEHTIKNQLNVVENTQASESLIRDADMADEMVKFSKEGILQQAGQSMLSQANQANQGVLSLLQ